MGVLTLVFALTSPLIVLHLLPHATTFQTVAGVSVVSGSGTNSVPAGSTQSPRTISTASPTDFRIARNSELNDFLTQLPAQQKRTLALVIVCDGLQSISGCNGVPAFSDYMQRQGSAILNQFPSLKRQKRSNFDNWFGWSPWPSSSWPSNSPWPSSNFPSFSNANAFVCPSFIDQSLVYQLNPNSADYPAEAIANELANSPELLACLLLQIVLETDGPRLVVENFRLTANATCPFTQLRLWRYTSLGSNGQCWVLANFQENILYRNCINPFCRDCGVSTIQSTYRHFNQPPTLNQKLCIPDYQQVSLWAFCPNRPIPPLIVRDRIIIPYACSCQSVACTPVLTGKK